MTKTMDEIAADLKKARAEQKADAERQKAEQQKTQSNMYAAARELVQAEDLYFVANLNYYLQKVDGKWIFLKPLAMANTWPEFNVKGFRAAFTAVMSDLDRIRKTCKYCINPGDGVLNLLDMSQWVRPIPGDHHWIFDVLMRSLGGGKAENIEHLEHVIAHHYFYPGSFMLPCIAISGEGGVGKNLLVDVLLYTIYAGATVSAMGGNIVGQFNSILKGVLAAMVNESQASKLDAVALKDMLHKPMLIINEKGIPQYTCDNLALYFVASNWDYWGGVMLDRSNADRRLSILHCEDGKTLLYWIAEETGWTQAEAKAWIERDGTAILSNRIECAKWLYYLKERYGDRQAPSALHAADYVTLLERQKHLSERLFEAVFGAESFTHVSCQTLFDCYKCLARDDGNHKTLGRNTFYAIATRWLGGHAEHIVKRDIHVSRDQKRSTWVNGNLLGGDLKDDNRSSYLAGLGIHATYQGPELPWA